MEKGKTGRIRMPNNFDKDDYLVFLSVLSDAEFNAKVLTEDVNEKQYKMKIRKAYFAGPWFDDRASELYKCCQRVEEKCRPFSPYEVFYPKEVASDTPEDAFYNNVKHIEEADVMIALVSRKDVGTAWEIGMAYKLGIPIVLVGYDMTTFLSHTNVMLAFTGECITINELANLLLDNEYDTIKIPNKWEGIE